MSKVIRRAKLQDIPAIVDLAVESVARNALPLRVARDRMVDHLKAGIPGNVHFCWVGEENGKLQACLAAQTYDGFWHERMVSAVALIYSRVPGLGIDLIREYTRWVKSRPTIKMATFYLEPEMDPRLKKVLHRLGFTHEGEHLSYVRGLNVGAIA